MPAEGQVRRVVPGCDLAGVGPVAGVSVGFQAIAGLIGSGVEYRRRDALDGRELGERFDFGCGSESG